MKVVFPAPLTPMTRITVGPDGGDAERRIAVPGPERSLDPAGQRVQELALALHRAPLRGLLDVGHQPHGGRHPEVGLEEQLLELLQRAGDLGAAYERADVGERDVLDALPERALG